MTKKRSLTRAAWSIWSVWILLVPGHIPDALAGQTPDSVFVRSVSFRGNENVDDLTLRLSIATTQASTFARWGILRWMGLGSKRIFSPRELRRDVLRVKAYYGASGFPGANVDTTIARSGHDVSIRFHIEEGAPVVVKSLVVNGTEALPSESTWRRSLPLKIGQPFNQLHLQPSVDLLRGLARDRGYPFARASASFQQDSSGNADIVLTLLPGDLKVVDSVYVEGVVKLEPEIVRRIVTVRPGQRFNAGRLYESQLALHRLGVFQSVHVGLRDSIPSESPDSAVSVFVRLREGSFQSLRFGAGYGTLDCMRALANWELYDFLGGGRILQLSTRLSQLGTGTPFDVGFERSICPALRDEDPSRLKANYHMSVSLTDPYFFFHRANATVSLFAERATEFQAFLRESFGGEVATGGRLRFGIPVSFSYSLSRGRTEADAATFCGFLNVCRFQDTQIFSSWRTRASLGLELSRSTTNALLDPTRGVRASLGLRWASPLIGSDTLIQFGKAELEVTGYSRFGRTTLAGRLRLGAIFSPEINLPSGRGRFVPPGERFFSGGPTTVRGFSQNQLGPLVRVLEGTSPDITDESTFQTSAVGGDVLLVANAEMRVPVSQDGPLSVAFFVDVGRLDSRSDDFTSGLALTPGLGARVRSPIGPIRFDIGYNPGPAPLSPVFRQEGPELVLVNPAFQPDRTLFSRLRFHFAVGQPF